MSKKTFKTEIRQEDKTSFSEINLNIEIEVDFTSLLTIREAADMVGEVVRRTIKWISSVTNKHYKDIIEDEKTGQDDS